MKKAYIEPDYPENMYCAIFMVPEYPNLPEDAEETLAYAINGLTEREATILMLRYKDKMTYAEIGKKISLSAWRVRQIIDTAEYKLQHLKRTKLFELGRTKYLHKIIMANGEDKRKLAKQIEKLEAIVEKQGEEIEAYKVKIIGINNQILPTLTVLDTPIAELFLSRRVHKNLVFAGIKTVKEVLDYGDLNDIEGMGKAGIQEVQKSIKNLLEIQEREIKMRGDYGIVD